jgi:superfamily II DNA or RNA helicase
VRTVRITYGVSYSYLEAPEGQFPGLIQYIRYALACRPEGFQFSTSFLEGRWDGYVHFCSEGGKFPTGLIPLVKERCLKLGYQPEVAGFPEPLPVPEYPPRLRGIAPYSPENPYWFQWEAVKKMLQGVRGVVKAPTASGKTTMAALLARCAPEKRILFLVDTIDLLDQTAEKFVDILDEPVLMIGDGMGDWNTEARIGVATVQTLMEKRAEDKRKDGSKQSRRKSKEILSPLWTGRDSLPVSWLKGVEVIFIDECHLVSSDAFYEVVMAFQNAHYRYGLSGTPFDRDDLNATKLIATCGETLVDIPTRTLINAGILADPIIHIVGYAGDDVDPGVLQANQHIPYKEVYEKLVWFDAQRTDAILSILAHSEKSLVLVQSKSKHGPYLLEAVRLGLPHRSVTYLSGDAGRLVRSKGRKAFINDDLDIIIATGIFDKGVDLPNVQTLILAGGGKSVVNVIQRVGRGMRIAEGKSTVDVWDMFDCSSKYLLDHTLQRIRVYEREGFTIRWESKESTPDSLAFTG